MKKFEIKENFILNGEEIKIISGSIHYFRSMPETWEDKILKLKALGANTVETYVPWNLHEPNEGNWDFSGHLNLPLFLKIAQENDMLIIVRFGPYICAEHDNGGFPWWIKKKNVRLRCNDENYLNLLEGYINKIVDVIKPYCSAQNGNVIMGQLENEYGSFGNDKEYLRKLLRMIKAAGFDEQIVTSDGTSGSMLEFGTLQEEGVLPTVNFGSNARYHFEYLSKYSDKKIPLMCMEFWCGWFSSWRSKEIIKTDAQVVARELDEILSLGSVNFYMFHGGTNFGTQGGANQSDIRGYTPDTTSYDYDALLDERGNITEKYRACKEVISKYTHVESVEFEYIPTRSYDEVKYIGSYNILTDDQLETCNSATPLTMEDLGYGYGYVLYETSLKNITKLTSLDLQGMQDRAIIYVNNRRICDHFDEKTSEVQVNVSIPENSTLSILVENTGRVNYGKYMESQEKGIKQGVFVNNHAYLFDWKMTKVDTDYSKIKELEFNHPKNLEPQVHKYSLNITGSDIEDTYINTENCGKGYIYVNGFNLGRFWEVGPQYNLYVPKQLLNKGENEVIVIETEGRFKQLKFEA